MQAEVAAVSGNTTGDNSMAVVKAPGDIALATRNFNDLEGDLTQSDMRLPYINIAQGIGPLSQQFDKGTLVFDKQVALSNIGGDPVNMIVLRARKCFQRHVEYGSDDPGEVVNSLAEVEERKGVVGWGSKDPDRQVWNERLDVTVLIEAPEGVETALFPLSHEGKSYAIGLWIMSNSAYRSAGKVILSARQIHLREGFITGIWGVTVEERKSARSTYYVPRFQVVGRTPEGLQVFIQELIGDR